MLAVFNYSYEMHVLPALAHVLLIQFMSAALIINYTFQQQQAKPTNHSFSGCSPLFFPWAISIAYFLSQGRKGGYTDI